MSQPILAADVGLNRIDHVAEVQQIKPHPTHAGHYSLRLSSKLWQRIQAKPILLVDQGRVLASLELESPKSPLVLQVNNVDGIKPIHLHIYGSQDESYGPLAINTAGRLSIYPGSYESLEANAKRVYLNKDQTKENSIRVKKKLALIASRAIIARSVIKAKSDIFLKSDREISLENKLSSKEKILVQGASLGLGSRGNVFSSQEIKFLVDKLVVNGKISAPLINIISTKGSKWSGSQIYAFVLSLHSEETNLEKAKFFLKHGLWVKGKIAAGLGEFNVGGAQNWHFPKLSKFTKKPAIEGCYFEVSSINFDGETKFAIASGNTSIKSTYAKIGNISSGIYNRFPLSLEAQKSFSLDGISSAFTVQLKSLYGAIKGHLYSTKTTAKVDQLEISGQLKAEKEFTNIGRSLYIAENASLNTSAYTFDQQNIKIAGELNARNVTGRTGQLSLAQTAQVNLSSATIHAGQSIVDGKLNVGSLDLKGHSICISPSGQFTAGILNSDVHDLNVAGTLRAGHLTGQMAHLTVANAAEAHIGSAALYADTTHVTGLMDVKHLNISGKSFNLHPLGQFRASTVTNNVPLWSLKGKGAIDSFSASVPHFSIDGAQEFAIKEAKLSADELEFSGHLNIANANINAKHWQLAPAAVFEGNIEAIAERAELNGHIAGQSFRGSIKDLYLSPSAHIDSEWVDLGGDQFRNFGAIDAKSSIQLDYKSYENLGELATELMAMTINDRPVNEELIADLNHRFKKLAIDTEQDLNFTKDYFVLPHGLSLAAKNISFSSKSNDPHRRSIFAVGGPLALYAKNGDLTFSRYAIGAESLRGYSGKDIKIHNTSIVTPGAQEYKALGNLYISPDVIEHRKETTKRSGFLNLQKTKKVSVWQEVLPSSLAAGGHISIESDGAYFDSAIVRSLEDISVHTKGPIKTEERKISSYSSIKKNTPISFAKIEETRESNVPTVFEAANNIEIESQQSSIDFSNVFIGGKKVSLSSKEELLLCLPTLKNNSFRESSGLFVCLPIVDLIKDPKNNIVSLNPITSALSSVNAATKNPINIPGALSQAAIHLYNANQLSNLMSLSLPGISFGFRSQESEVSFSTPGIGGIFAEEEIALSSKEKSVKTLNGFPLHAKALLISCPVGNWEKGGFKEEKRASFNCSSMSIGLPLTMPNMQFSCASGECEQYQWLPQDIQCESINVIAKDIITHEGVNFTAQSREGFGFNLSQYGGGAFIISGENELGISYMAPNAKVGTIGYVGLNINGANFVLPLVGQVSDSVTKDISVNKEAEIVFSNNDTEIAKKEPLPQNLVRRAKKPKAPPSDTNDNALTQVGDFYLAQKPYWQDEDEYQMRPIEVDERSFLLDNTSGIIEGIGDIAEGIVDGLVGIITLARDTAIIYAANSDAALNREFGLDEEENPSIKDTSLYKNALKNMEQRGEGLSLAADYIRDAGIFIFGALYESTLQDIMPLDGDRSYIRGNETFENALDHVVAPLMLTADMDEHELIKLNARIATNIFLPLKAPKFIRPTPEEKVKKKSFKHLVKDPKKGRWWPVEINYGGHHSVDVNLDITDHQIEAWKKSNKAPYIIHGHGTNNTVLQVTNSYKVDPTSRDITIFETKKRLNAEQLASLIREIKDYRDGQPIFLLSCSTGKGYFPIAQELANQLNTVVLAPTGLISVDYSGHLFVSRFSSEKLHDMVNKYQNFLKKNKIQWPFGEIKAFYSGQQPAPFISDELKLILKSGVVSTLIDIMALPEQNE